MNNRGDVPTLLIFFAALVLIIISLVSMHSFSNSFGKFSEDTTKIMVQANLAEGYILEKLDLVAFQTIKCNSGKISDSNGCNLTSLNERFAFFMKQQDFGVTLSKNLFDKIANREFNFNKSGNNYILEINNLEIFVVDGQNAVKNSVKRTLNLKMEFDSQGEFIRFINK